MGAALRERVTTIPNVITVLRTVAGMTLAIWSLAAGSMALLVAAYATYWLGDILDGVVARALNQETVIGAVFDVICDRANTTLAAAAFVALRPESAAPIIAFLVQFCVLDTMLTLAFLYFPGIISPNYFGRVDGPIYRYNWSAPAKAANTSVVVLLCLVHLPWPALAWALLMTAVKLWSLVRLAGILTGRVPAAPVVAALAKA